MSLCDRRCVSTSFSVLSVRWVERRAADKAKADAPPREARRVSVIGARDRNRLLPISTFSKCQSRACPILVAARLFFIFEPRAAGRPRSRASSMHDIRWFATSGGIRSRLGRGAGSLPRRAADRHRRAPPRRHRQGRASPGRPQRGIEGNRRGQEGEGRAACQALMAEGRRMKASIPALEAEEKAASQELE